MRKILFDNSIWQIKSAVGYAAIFFLFVVAPVNSVFGAGSTWSAQKPISPALQPDPTRGSQLNDVAVNASGQTIAAWDQYTYNYGGNASIGVAVQSGGRWNTPCFFSDTSGSCIDPKIASVSGFSMNPRVAVGADGTMAVSWIYQDPATQANQQQKIQVAVKPAGPTSTWTTSTLDTGTVGGVAITQFVPVAVDASGNVTAAWSLWDGYTNKHLVKAATLPKGRTWSSPVNLAPGVDGIFPSLAINSKGDAAVAFVISAWAYSSTGTNAQYVFRSGPTDALNTWTTPVVVSEFLSSSTGYITNPVVALDDFGLATVAYFGYGVEAVRQLSVTAWTSPQAVLTAPNSVSSYGSIDLGIDQTGNSVIAASIFDATVGVDRSSVYVALGLPQGTWLPQQRLTDPTAPVDAYATRVAMSADGTLALVGWIDHYHGTVQVSKLSGTLGAGGGWGAATTIGRGTAFSSFQEVLGLDAGSGTVARAIWKNAKSGTQIYASSYN